MSGQMELQRELGNVQAGVEDVHIVLTHTCRIRATIRYCCRAQATVRVWDKGCARNWLQDASRQSVCSVRKFPGTPAWNDWPSMDKEKIQVRWQVRATPLSNDVDVRE
jgi:hypothetical protein